MAKDNRFAALQSLRKQRQDQEENQEDVLPETEAPPVILGEEEEGRGEEMPVEAMPPKQSKSQLKKETSTEARRGPGRPPGRRSNPEYTQISAYIPLDLLLEVQDELAEERRERRQRTPRPVSDLVEALLDDWLKKRKRKNANS